MTNSSKSFLNFAKSLPKDVEGDIAARGELVSSQPMDKERDVT